MVMTTPPIFEVFVHKHPPHEWAAACQVSDENMDLLLDIVGGSIRNGVLSFTPATPAFDGEAEIGDYILSDMAGNYIVVDKEMFESHYARAAGTN